MSKKLKSSQANPEEHSEIKVQLLKKYMEAYVNILSNSPYIDGVILHDLFCGPGKYPNDKLGSPLIFLNEIIDAHNRDDLQLKSSTTFECYFNDLDSEKTEHLKGQVHANSSVDSLPIFITISNEDYRNILPQVIEKYSTLTSKRAFAFIDPYGYKDIRVEDIRSLLESGKSEVLLFLPTQFMYRFSENGTPVSLSAFIKELGIKVSPTETGISFIEKVKEGFRNQLGTNHFVDSFIIQRDKNQFFALFFFTSHILGYEKMLKAKWSLDEHEGRGWQPKIQPDLFTEVDEQPEIRPLEDRLQEFLAQPRSNGGIYEFTLRAGFLPTHTITALKQLDSVGKLNIAFKERSRKRKGAYYINYDNWKKDFDKIHIKLK
ncbi:MAG: hypothetical protein CL840_18395 [Crocinitomicaceae bacterium]|nr:hypothetical protein [Crocinitomicaceae bacterium]|tara:strand:+ start:1768 stop:2892 length:1125 start_codon:yes stop_codon:yes gene_type:complete